MGSALTILGKDPDMGNTLSKDIGYTFALVLGEGMARDFHSAGIRGCVEQRGHQHDLVGSIQAINWRASGVSCAFHVASAKRTSRPVARQNKPISCAVGSRNPFSARRRRASGRGSPRRPASTARNRPEPSRAGRTTATPPWCGHRSTRPACRGRHASAPPIAGRAPGNSRWCCHPARGASPPRATLASVARPRDRRCRAHARRGGPPTIQPMRNSGKYIVSFFMRASAAAAAPRGRPISQKICDHRP